ncbi:hypothetical protein AALP_AA5G122300 [Arabis alpina]|uniref:Uncharacterized protein n=1 Tax=Arabis alpina TaxID=50452 RepID=A0A087GWL1_ARAAL|nr:hypothetical protein AALP_AA5G122300 [Arabis alpina]
MEALISFSRWIIVESPIPQQLQLTIFKKETLAGCENPPDQHSDSYWVRCSSWTGKGPSGLNIFSLLYGGKRLSISDHSRDQSNGRVCGACRSSVGAHSGMLSFSFLGTSSLEREENFLFFS